MDEDVWYFAYGSNLSLEQMQSRTGSLGGYQAARLADYAFRFQKLNGSSEVYANIVPSAGSSVHGIIYQCSPASMQMLDLFEGVDDDCYRRLAVVVTTGHGSSVAAVAYVGGSAFSLESAAPSDSYLSIILNGAREHNFCVDYIERSFSPATANDIVII